MPVNNGRHPSHDRVDIKMRNGWVVRDIDPKGWRWKPWPDGESAGDIIVWQPAGALREWSGKK